jgi:hypothetical protein
MNSRRHLLWFALVFLPAGAAAQRVQNMDISFLAGATAYGSQAVPGSSAIVDGGVDPCVSFRYGYQLARASAASFWLEVATSFQLGGSAGGNLPGSTLRNFNTFTLGGRFMVPVHSRVSIYGALGGGEGGFYYPVVDGAKPYIKSNDVFHGVLEFGGGVDVRLIERISFRTEVRDFVTGRGLNGATGRHHILPFAGVSFHF